MLLFMAKASSYFLYPTLCLMIMSFSASFCMISRSITTDESTLLVLKDHLTTANPESILARNWSSTTAVCSWTGVTCGGLHHRVVKLNLSSMGLAGAIPPQLGNLSYLLFLDLSHNRFHGRLPTELSRLHRLNFMILSNNSLTGAVPASFFNISKLEHLILYSNLLQGIIPPQIGNLSNLKRFYAHDNRFVGAIPSGIGNLGMLEVLSLGDNGFEGMIPQEIGDLQKLDGLYLSNNKLSGSIPTGIFNISRLRFLDLGENNLSGTLPSTMGPMLQILYLVNNSLAGNIPESISNSSQLTELSLELNEFTGPIPTSLGSLRLLTCLHLHGNSLTNGAWHGQELSFITSLTNCPNLNDVTISNNPLDGLLPASIGNLSVSRFYASRCEIKGKIPDEIANLSKLRELHLEGNHLSFPKTFRGLQKLQGLFLENNNLRGSFPSSLCDLPELSVLSLSQNQISGPIPDCIGSVTSLRNIYLAFNTLTSIPSRMWSLVDLLELNLSSNSLTGNLPQEVENLKVATLIDLSKNGFTGVIPNASRIMQYLIHFSLASNRLQGSIPESFGSMISLEWLDLSDNDLSGEIPKLLEQLHYLKHFNVSFNKLRGEIPSGGPFKDFTYLYFVSNGALCGDPRLHVPRCRYSTSNTKRRKLIIVVSVLIIGSSILMTILVLSWMMRRGRKAASSEADPFLMSSKAERFTYKRIQQATDCFSQANLLGSGSFGSVYRATFEKGSVLAVKVFNLQVEYATKSFETECKILRSLRHRNLTKVISACSNLDFKAIVLEYMHNGSLEKWLYSDGCFLDVIQRLNVMIDVASALEYLHHGYTKPVVHCDLKPSNILLDGDMVGHVTDFGITKLLVKEESVVHTQTLATLGYMAPEYGAEGLVSSACDVYSYGILLMETFTRKRPSDDMFGDELSLRSWIKATFPDSVYQVADSNLTNEEDEHFIKKIQCISSIMALAVYCTVESPIERMDMKNVLIALKKIKAHFTGV